MNQFFEPHLDKCAPIAGSAGALFGKITCPENGTDIKVYTDKDCTKRCELDNCKKVESTYTQQWGDCFQHDGAYITVTGANMMATGVAASLLAVAASIF